MTPLSCLFIFAKHGVLAGPPPIYTFISAIIGVNITAFGRKLTLSAIPLSRFSLKCPAYFAYFEFEKCALLSVKWNSDDSATTFQYSAKLIRSAKLCVFCLFLLSPGRVAPGITITTGYRSSGKKIRVASRRSTTVPVASSGGGKNTTCRFLRFFVRSVLLFHSLMLTPMSYLSTTCFNGLIHTWL